MITTAVVLAGTDTCYYGPTCDRLPIAEAHARGILHFVVDRDHVYVPLGETSHFGSFKTVEEAVAAAKPLAHLKGLRISAIAAPFGFTGECTIWTSWWKPYGDL